MDFGDKILALAARVAKQKTNVQTEEAAKTAFVMPFIQALGYDVFDPNEVVPEFIADVGSKKGEKIDYAIMVDGEPAMLIECKCCNCSLEDEHAGQLRRYFHVTAARIGVLTNGITYMFFSDLDKPNIMDVKPFMEIDLLDLNEQYVPELKKLSKSGFELDQMLSTASDLKYMREIKAYFEQQMTKPDVDFVRLVLSEVYSGMKTQSIIEQFTPLIKKALNSVINDHINARLKSAMTPSVPNEPQETSEELQIENNDENKKGIITTDEEIEGYYIIRAILCSVVDVERVTMRDTKSYCGILLDNNNRKPLCRMHFNGPQKYIGLIGAEKTETRVPIDGLSSIYDYTDQIRAAVTLYDNDAGE